MILQYNFLKAWMLAHTKNERAASLVEYALLVSLIAVVCIAAVSALGGKAKDTFNTTANSMTPSSTTP